MALSLKQLLQGRWLGHPLHPAVVHLPVGLWISAPLFDIASCLFPSQQAPLATAALWAIAVGLIAALLAIPTGLADWWDIKSDKPAHRLGLWHLGLNLAAFILFAINLVYRWSSPSVSAASLLLSLIGAAAVCVSGYIGGRMVYDQGTGIARHSKGKWRQLAEAGGANLPVKES